MRLTSKIRRLLCAGLLLTATLTGPALAQETAAGWEEIPRPNVGKGLMMEPRMLGFGSRLHLVWVGTNETISRPEVFHTSISGGSKEWTNPRAPFFGANKSRVRRVAIGRSRTLLGLVFQRTLTQGNDAYEVLFALSGDHGWSWGSPVELDSFVAEVSGGTAVAIEGREGPNRIEFTMAWSRDFGNVRVANMDIKSSVRPEGVVVGQHVEGAMKADVAALGKDGFSVVYNNGQGLSSAHARALVGKVDEGISFLRGRFGKFFTVASRPYGPSRLAVGEGSTILALSSNETTWKNDDQVGILPFSAGGVSAESDLDEQQDLHVAMLVPTSSAYEIWYIGQTDKKWGKAEMVLSLPSDKDMRGFDIGVTDDYVFVAASQGFEAKFLRKKHSK
jgi:hypothetical protein